MAGYQVVKNFDDIFSRLIQIMSVTDRTDGQIGHSSLQS